MHKYYITTDRTADLPSQFYEEDLAVIPMSYTLDGVLYDGESRPFLPSDKFYDALAEGKLSSTSMVSADAASAFFEDILKKGCDILHISFSSALSGCYDSYLKAADALSAKYPDRKIIVIDSKAASVGEGLLVYYALKKRREGASLDENASYTEELKNHIGHAFTVNDMFHLYRGGRVSKGAAVVGSAINIKPVLMVNEKGELIPTNKVIGRRLAVRSLVDKMEKKGAKYRNDVIIIGHGNCYDDAEELKHMVTERFGKQNIIITDIGAVIGSHCGKGVLALFYLCDDKQVFVK